ncbi:proto-oncogene Mas-like [Pogoniulus pusillus]|uniref:proto-oncogene Mas-like n=1 Tax=Pogoniulus pusillus TaxID=488313 RepID=UPI0030B94A49
MPSGPADSQGLSHAPCKSPNPSLLITSRVFTCICFCGLVGNVVVVWLLGCRMKRNPFTVYVLNLAVADCSLLLTLLVLFTIFTTSTEYCQFSDALLLSIGIMVLLFLLCYLAGMYLLTAMSVERCLAAVFPVWYRCHRPKRLSGILCGVLWALATLLVLLSFLVCAATDSCVKVFGVLSIVNFVLFSVLPLLSNLALFIKLRCGSQRRHPGRLYVAVLLSVTFLVIFGLPLSVSSLLPVFNPECVYISCLLASLNSSINPVLYFLLGSCRQRRFRCSLKVAFRRLFEEEATREERSQEPGDDMVETSV